MKDPKGDKDKDKKRKMGFLAAGIILALVLSSMLLIAYVPNSPWYMWWVDEDDEAVAPTIRTTSSFTLIDYATGEDVSGWVEVTLWGQDPDADFDQDADPYTRTNFETIETSTHADDLSEDLRDGDYFYLEIDPDDDSVYGGYDAASAYSGSKYAALTDDYRFILGGGNYDYYFYVYHLPTNTSINVLNRGANVGMGEWYDTWNITHYSPMATQPYTENGTFVVVMDLPRCNTTDGLHKGDAAGQDWSITDEEYADMSYAELLWLWDQRNFRTQAPFYDIQDDQDKGFEDELEMLTNAFAVRFTFNDTVSDVQYNHQEVNFSLIQRNFETYDIDVVYTGVYIYCIFTAPITWTNGDLYSFDFYIETAWSATVAYNGIKCNAVDCGRLAVPNDISPLGAYTILGDAPLRVAGA